MLDGLDVLLQRFLSDVRPKFPEPPVLFADESGGALHEPLSQPGDQDDVHDRQVRLRGAITVRRGSAACNDRKALACNGFAAFCLAESTYCGPAPFIRHPRGDWPTPCARLSSLGCLKSVLLEKA